VHPPLCVSAWEPSWSCRGSSRPFRAWSTIWADHGYACALRLWTRKQTGIDLETVYAWRYVKRYFPDMLGPLGIDKGFHVLPRRWAESTSPCWDAIDS
jgi:hypothetical protein